MPSKHRLRHSYTERINIPVRYSEFSHFTAEPNPFKSFSNIESPDWWDAYNKVKHKYSLHYQKASVTNVLQGLAGAFLLNAVHYPSIKLLWQLRYLKAGAKAGRDFAEVTLSEEHFESYLESATRDFKPLNIDIRVETPLFLFTSN